MMKSAFLFTAAVMGTALIGVPLVTGALAAEQAVPIPRAAIDVPRGQSMQTAVLAGGCFWGMEAVFEGVKGVRDVVSGFAGGTAKSATYDAVSTERTAHAEAIRITYDPRIVSYAQLLRVYFAVARDPTQLNRQGPDTGPSYRSAIFPQTADQKRVAAAYIAQLGAAKAWPKPIVTRIESGKFYPAEAHHQDFARKNPMHPYILRWDKPKVAAFRAAFPGMVKT
jgi:peptide-methionine (S)-S-oxide reductase